jgi:hypothetical protein
VANKIRVIKASSPHILLQDAQKGRPARPQPMKAPEA